MSDGIIGGGTAFPKLGVVAFPVKGSVVFWHSLRDDGKIDRKSLHGGCPTVHGIKWGKKRILQWVSAYEKSTKLGLNRGAL